MNLSFQEILRFGLLLALISFSKLIKAEQKSIAGLDQLFNVTAIDQNQSNSYTNLEK